MFNKFFDRLFNGSNERDIKKMRQLVEEKINPQESALKKLSDSSLANKTNEFKARLAKGETLDDILPDAFAVIREASRRVLGMRQFDVQLIGGIILHRGNIAEMGTGEGKTLVATALLCMIWILNNEKLLIIQILLMGQTMNSGLIIYVTTW